MQGYYRCDNFIICILTYSNTPTNDTTATTSATIITTATSATITTATAATTATSTTAAAATSTTTAAAAEQSFDFSIESSLKDHTYCTSANRVNHKCKVPEVVAKYQRTGQITE